MPIFIYNSLKRKKEEFVPLKQQRVKIYVCGPTVYDEPHIGHARSAYIFDVIRRYLQYRGYTVEFVRNVTDVDDKIIDRAKNEFPGEDLKIAVEKVAAKYLSSYHNALDNLGISTSRADIREPKASEYIPRMVKFIQRLIARGAAYCAGGDVYFDITKAKDYGKLSHQSMDKMEVGARVSPVENKRNPLDFALWKSAKPDEPSWDSPWGKGRPGWHIECSVMSSDILGDEFDIHGGGIDLIFPHHENEIAQSEGAGNKFARYWMHHGLLTINDQKMAKSLGNFVTVKDFINKYKDPDLLKLLFLSAHYSHPIDYNAEKIEEASKQKNSFEGFFDKVNNWGLLGEETKIAASAADRAKINNICDQFEKAMDDDFNMPGALACLFGLVDLGSAFVSQDKKETFNYAKAKLENFFGLLGLKVTPKKEIPEELLVKLSEIEAARANKDFKKADMIREEIKTKFKFAVSNTVSNITITEIKQ